MGQPARVEELGAGWRHRLPGQHVVDAVRIVPERLVGVVPGQASGHRQGVAQRQPVLRRLRESVGVVRDEVRQPGVDRGDEAAVERDAGCQRGDALADGVDVLEGRVREAAEVGLGYQGPVANDDDPAHGLELGAGADPVEDVLDGSLIQTLVRRDGAGPTVADVRRLGQTGLGREGEQDDEGRGRYSTWIRIRHGVRNGRYSWALSIVTGGATESVSPAGAEPAGRSS